MVFRDYYIDNAPVVALFVAAVGGMELITGTFDFLGSSGNQEVSERDLAISTEKRLFQGGLAVNFIRQYPKNLLYDSDRDSNLLETLQRTNLNRNRRKII